MEYLAQGIIGIMFAAVFVVWTIIKGYDDFE